MKKLLIIFAFILIVSPLWSHSIKFVAMDRYYNEEVPIDSILVHDMNTGEEKLYLTDSLFFETVSSVEEQTKVNSLHLYPNPVEDILNINTNSSEIIISDISGKVHYKSSTVISGSITLNVAGLPQGVYAIRTRNKSQTFIKNTPSNGQDIRLISTSSTPHSLVKEAEVQSQFDYRFTIYSDGFKPKNYYTKALTKDTVVELDMSTLTSPFDGKHIRVSLFLSKLEIIKHGQHHNNADTYNTTYNDYIYSYTDTIVIRDSICSINRKTIPKNSYFTDTDYDRHNFLFIIDKDSLVKEFSFSRSFKCSYRYDYSMAYEEKSISLNLKVNLDLRKSNTFLISDFKEVQLNLNSKNSTSQNHGGSSYYTDIYGPFNTSNSYIKIEFID